MVLYSDYGTYKNCVGRWGCITQSPLVPLVESIEWEVIFPSNLKPITSHNCVPITSKVFDRVVYDIYGKLYCYIQQFTEMSTIKELNKSLITIYIVMVQFL